MNTDELRDYFAAHAPPAPEWWPAAQPVKAPYVAWPEWMNDPDTRDQFHHWRDDDHEPHPSLLPLFREHADKIDNRKAAQAKHDQNAMLGREAEWRFAYADAMLAARGKS